MARLNPHFDKLAAGYLFPEIGRRTAAFVDSHPDAEVMRLGIGDTTEPLVPAVLEGLHRGVDIHADAATYKGYPPDQGSKELRQALADRYATYGAHVTPEEIFVSDGAKPDSANIQQIFAQDSVVAVQDPAYPVYVDSNVMAGRTGKSQNGQYEGLVYMPCNEGNGFFPELPDRKVDLIYICSPNNPTGAVATKEQIKQYVDYAIENGAALIFDAAYAPYIKDPDLPRSVYEIEGARKCAIEINSFSKDAGFTGIRLGWTVVPDEMVVEGAEAGAVRARWARRQATMFNGASNIVVEGGLAALSDAGREQCGKIVDYYMENARLIRSALQELGLTVFGGDNAPYIWMKTPNGIGSWEFFDKLLNETHVVGTPGAGFGPSGEGFFRLSAFGHRNQVERAVSSIKEKLTL